MKVLFVDDSWNRHDFFCMHKHHDHGRLTICAKENYSVAHVYTAHDAIQYLDKYNDVNILFLDHDLSSTDPKNSGMIVADFLAKNPKKFLSKIDKIIIHSWNAHAAQEMKARLSDTGYICLLSPFAIA